MPAPARPKGKKRRIVVRYQTKRVEDGLWWGMAYDTGNNRYVEADVQESTLEALRDTCRDRVNKSFSAKAN